MIEWILPNLFRITVLLLFLIVVAFDLKSREIPSLFTTGILFFISVINISHIPYGIIAFIFAWMLYEAEFLEGIADVKMIAALGLMIFNLNGLFHLVIMISVAGAIYISGLKFIKVKEIPFTPLIVVAYLGLWNLGVI